MTVWPRGFERIPDEEWTTAEVDPFATGYDDVGKHGWYANLDPTVDAVLDTLDDGRVAVDYSGGTGLLIDRILARAPDTNFGLINVDASAKFLRLALEKHRDDPRVAFRLLRFQPERMRLQALDEVIRRDQFLGVATIACANAIHLYPDLADTAASWRRTLRPGGTLLVQSGNMGSPGDHWIIDDTVHALADAAKAIVRRDARFGHYRAALDDATRMLAHDALRKRYFLPVRPVDDYVSALSASGLTTAEPEFSSIAVDVDEWLGFLDVYSDGIIGWVGGTKRVEGKDPSDLALADRRTLLHEAADAVFGKRQFTARWTYLTATR